MIQKTQESPQAERANASNAETRGNNPKENNCALTGSHIAALEARGLGVDFLLELGWRSNNNFLEIPYYRDNQEVNCKSRTLHGEKRFMQVAGGVKCFYNEDAIKAWQELGGPLLICEGEIDCATALQCGYWAVSVPDGAPAKELDETTVKYGYLDGFPTKGEVIICADGDAAGANLLHDLGIRLGKHRCKWVQYPKGCKDLNDALIKYGERGVHETIARAQWLAVNGIYRMSELPPMGKPESKPCQIIPINIRKADFSVWTGIPSHGKSTLTNHISYILAKQGWTIGVASFEQSPQTQHRYNLRTLYCDLAAQHATPEDLGKADGWIDNHYSLIVPDIDADEDADLGWLLEKMAAAVVRHGVDMFIIDPWNELDHTFNRRELSQTDYTGFAVKQLKKFARKYNVHVAVVAHPAKMQRGKDGAYPIPTLYDVADSAHWANKADLGIVVHRQDDGTTLVRVQKSRYHQDIGKPDDYILDFDETTKRYSKSGATYSYGG